MLLYRCLLLPPKCANGVTSIKIYRTRYEDIMHFLMLRSRLEYFPPLQRGTGTRSKRLFCKGNKHKHIATKHISAWLLPRHTPSAVSKDASFLLLCTHRQSEAWVCTESTIWKTFLSWSSCSWGCTWDNTPCDVQTSCR